MGIWQTGADRAAEQRVFIWMHRCAFDLFCGAEFLDIKKEVYLLILLFLLLEIQFRGEICPRY